MAYGYQLSQSEPSMCPSESMGNRGIWVDVKKSLSVTTAMH